MPFFSGDSMRAWMWLALSLGLLSPMPILAMELSFAEAQELLMEVSDAIAGSQNQLEGRQHLARASKSLSYPEVTLDVKQMRFAKSLDLNVIQPLAVANGWAIPPEVDVRDWRTRPIRSEEHTSELQSR